MLTVQYHSRGRRHVDVYKTLRDAIQYLELMPGTMIDQAELREQLGVSQTPVRDALLSLSKEFLVDVHPQVGTYVSRIDFHMAQEIAYMRHILDTEICMTLAEKKTDLQESVSELLVLMRLAVQQGKVTNYIKLDNQFHRVVFAADGHEMIWDIISNCRAQYNRFLSLEMQMPGVLKKSYQEHRDMIKYIKSGDLPALRELLDEHHDHATLLERAELLKKKFPEYFPDD